MSSKLRAMLDKLSKTICWKKSVHVTGMSRTWQRTLELLWDILAKSDGKKGRYVGCLEHDPSPPPFESCMIQITAQVGDHLRWEEDGAHGGYEEDLGLHQEVQTQWWRYATFVLPSKLERIFLTKLLQTLFIFFLFNNLSNFRKPFFENINFRCEISGKFEKLLGEIRRFWSFPWKLLKFGISGNASSKLVNFGQQLQKRSDILEIKLQTCENVWRNLVELLNSERSKRL